MRRLAILRFRCWQSEAARKSRHRALRFWWIRGNRTRSTSRASKVWFAGVKNQALPLGDYSIAGLEDRCAVERKDLADLVHSLTVERSAFVKRLHRMSEFPHRLLVITAPLSRIKSPYPWPGNPNHIFQSLIAIFAGLNLPFLCTDTHELGEEVVASYLYQVHLYHWLESNDYGRFIVDDDL
jgi:hypothetical protein